MDYFNLWTLIWCHLISNIHWLIRQVDIVCYIIYNIFKLATYWNLPPDEKVSRRKHPACKRANADCSLMDNSHWKTPPYWTSKSYLFTVSTMLNLTCLALQSEIHTQYLVWFCSQKPITILSLIFAVRNP